MEKKAILEDFFSEQDKEFFKNMRDMKKKYETDSILKVLEFLKSDMNDIRHFIHILSSKRKTFIFEKDLESIYKKFAILSALEETMLIIIKHYETDSIDKIIDFVYEETRQKLEKLESDLEQDPEEDLEDKLSEKITHIFESSDNI